MERSFNEQVQADEEFVDASRRENTGTTVSSAAAPRPTVSSAAAPRPTDPGLPAPDPAACAAVPACFKLQTQGARCAARLLDGVRCSQPARLRLATTSIVLYVSSHEEDVTVRVHAGDALVLDLGAHSHNQLLLALARRRIADEAAGFATASCGWVHPDDYPNRREFEASRINLAVFRARNRLRKLGFVDADALVERRRGSGELRLGVPHPVVISQ
jgi:hypothetical protein